jgi:hypothetical protein
MQHAGKPRETMKPMRATLRSLLAAVLTWVVAAQALGCHRAPTKEQVAVQPRGEEHTARGPSPATTEQDAPDVPASNAALRKRCDASALESCVKLGDRLREGRDVGTDAEGKPDLVSAPVDYEAALELYHRACDRGLADGCAQLGVMSLGGLGVPTNVPEAIDLLQRACDAGAGRGCTRLGALYLTATVVPRDLARAFAFSEAGCKSKDGMGCVNLGLMHDHGDGVKRDTEHACQLFHSGCMLGEGRGCALLAEHYGSGDGIEQNAKLAEMFNGRGCALGDGRACGNAGVGFQLGFGSAPNPKRAAQYFSKACAAGESRYCELLQRFEKNGPTVPVTKH